MAYSGNSAAVSSQGGGGGSAGVPPPPPGPPSGGRGRSPSGRRSLSPRGGSGRRSLSPPRGGRPPAHADHYDSRGTAPYDGPRGGSSYDHYGSYGPPRGGPPSYGGGYDRGYDDRGPYPPRGPGGYGGGGGYGGPPPPRYGGGGYGGPPRYGGGGGYGGGYGRRSPPPRRRYEVIKGNEEERLTSTCLYVGNLPYTFREEDVQDLFDRYGRLVSVSVPQDRFTGRNKGFAFVTYEDRRDAEDAKNKYDSHQVEGRRLKIDWDIGQNKKDQIKNVSRPPRESGPDGAPAGDDYGRDRGRSPPPSAGRRSPQYSPYRKRSPSPYSSARHP